MKKIEMQNNILVEDGKKLQTEINMVLLNCIYVLTRIENVY